MKKTIRNILMLSLISKVTYGWGDLGHSTVGYIAQQNLTPEGRALVMKYLGVEPLAVSATWPDHVRSDKRFDIYSSYHFLEIPEGTKVTIPMSHDRAEKDAHSIIETFPKLLKQVHKKNSKLVLSKNQIAVMFRYFVHVVGDVHMPIHVGNGMDMGANLCTVKLMNPYSKKYEVSNLHKVWDEGLMSYVEKEFIDSNKTDTSGKRWFGYKEFGEWLIKDIGSLAKYEMAINSVPENWYQESKDLHRLVYPDAESNMDPTKRSFCKVVDPITKKVIDKKIDLDTVPQLGEILNDGEEPTSKTKYITTAVPKIKDQILMAGYRLAGQINKLARDLRISPMASDAEAKFFAPITPINKK